MTRKTFLIAPVRGHAPDKWRDVVAMLERDGWSVHWPARDTNQDDPNGFGICQQNHRAIWDADAVHVAWDGQSQGCLFDLGMAFAMGKRIHVLELPPATAGKSFQNMILHWAALPDEPKAAWEIELAP